MAGGGGGIDTDIGAFENRALGWLEEMFRFAVPYSEFFTEKAIAEQRRQFDVGRADLEKFYNIGQAQGTPYREAGYAALDKLLDLQGIPRLNISSSDLAKAEEAQAMKQGAQAQLGASADQLISQLNVRPETAFAMRQSIVHGGNLPGVMQGLEEYLERTPSESQNLKATRSRYESAPGTTHSKPGDKTFPSPFNNVLQQTQNRFHAPLAQFLTQAMPASSALRRADTRLTSEAKAALQALKGGRV